MFRFIRIHYLFVVFFLNCAAVNLKAGKTKLVFTNLSPKINSKSIRITTGKNIDLLGITSTINYLAKEKNLPRTKRLQDSLQLISDKIQNISDQSDAYTIEKKCFFQIFR